MTEFTDNLDDVFALFGPIQAKAMFGGYGIYHDELMFGLVVDDVLYLKADNQSAEAFVAKGLPAFEYVKQGKTIKVSYYQAPEEIYDDQDQARSWAELALAAARRGRRSK